MAGSRSGGLQAAATNKQRYGADFYKRIAAEGGRSSNTGGFASEKRDAKGRTGRERARLAGQLGGKASHSARRTMVGI